ncbi:cell envelope integrity protein CreD [Fulvivirga sp. M361]|uniref:cell envelope integrity protein CreD n=1 Tax=Fulvivirga sp. M361 TaxID=2594266 RepID=UPI00117BAD6D|nr:cell envelope integrity protein CreD [Fulvivirga sp. M361]TRX49349.1 cell envelope integrity protein CreD [Fulvivirga sp. M361]
MNENRSFFDRLNHWTRTSIGLKIFIIGFLVLILLIPVSMVEDLIYERQQYQQNAIEEVSSKWGTEQTLTGLILSVPYYTYNTVKNDDGSEKLIKKKQVAHFLPDQLNISGNISPEKRYRGIYEVVVYNSTLKISGTFEKPNFKKLNIEASNATWDKATISLGLSDLRSIQNEVQLNWLKEKVYFEPGLKSNDVVQSGISANVLTDSVTSSYPFELTLEFNGSKGLSFTPLGKTTIVDIQSNWAEPSFDGAFLPDTREVTQEGFNAHWKVLHLNRNYPQQFTGGIQVRPSDFGVRLIMPVDQYRKSTRSVKYAVMIISLTFLIYFFSQIKTSIRIHPIQYLIIGLALCLFFTLLIALSEHMSFYLAYFTGSISIVVLITSYSYFIFKNSLLTKVLAGLLVMLYGFIYIIIQLQDYSLLIGSVALFVILGFIMYMSRNIDWYNIGNDS